MLVADSSALIALIRKEKGGDALLPYIGHMLVSAVNFSECIKVLQQNDTVNPLVGHTLNSLVEEVVPFDRELALETANLNFHAKPFGLSLGDRACIALGMKRKLPIFTADKIWAKLGIDADIRLIR